MIHTRALHLISLRCSAQEPGVVGNHGQAAYCATTTFLGSFASYRASLGLAASTINLGVVLGAGWLVDKRSKVQDQVKMVIGTEKGSACRPGCSH